MRGLIQGTRLHKSLADISVHATSGSAFWLQTLGIGLLSFAGGVALALFTLPIVGVFAGVGAAVLWLTIRNVSAEYRRTADHTLSILAAVGFVLATLVGSIMVRPVYMAHFGTSGIATELADIGPSHAPRARAGDRCVVRMPDHSTEVFKCLRPGDPLRTANGGYPVYYDTHLRLPPRVDTAASLHAGIGEGLAGGALAFAVGTTVVGLGRTRPGVLSDGDDPRPQAV
ncbi:hypothetical protein [Catenulispora subtropica]|uniref:Uncharacterized protein n=1 Tax=Catenulispora subtropica TaxID=450798 RepID=A0ABN2TCF7_9ACTN